MSRAACSQARKGGGPRSQPAKAPGQIAAVVGLLEIMLDPLAPTLASAPYDDEPVCQEEACEIEAAKGSLARGEGIPHEKVLAEFG